MKGIVAQNGRKMSFSMVFFCVLFILMMSGSPAESVIQSVRTGMQPKGPRIVLDLDGPTDYGVITRGGRLYIHVKAPAAKSLREIEDLPRNDLVAGCFLKQEGGNTLIEIVFSSEKADFRHFQMTKPDRIVIDFFPKGQQPPALPQPIGAVEVPLHGKKQDSSKTLEELLCLVPETYTASGFTESLEIPLTGRSNLFDGAAEREYAFELFIPEEWRFVDDSYVELILQGYLPDDSPLPPMDVFFNGYPLKIVTFDRIESGKSRIKFAVLPEYFSPGTNRLVFLEAPWLNGSGIPLIEENRMVIKARAQFDLHLADFPKAFVPSEKDTRLFIVIPEGFSLQVYQAGLRVMQVLQKEIKKTNMIKDVSIPAFVTFPLLVKEALSGRDFSGDHLIFLGEFDSLGPEFKRTFGLNKKPGADIFLSCFVNKQGGSRLYVGAADKAKLEKAVEILLRKDIKERLDTQKLEIFSKNFPPASENNAAETIEEKGTEVSVAEKDLVFTGEGYHRQSIEAPAAILHPPGKGPKLGLIVRYSRYLDGDSSWVAVAPKGQKSEPIMLDPTASGKKMLVLPTDSLNKAETTEIEIEAVLRLKKGTSSDESRTAWCVVEKDARFFSRIAEKPSRALLENIGLFMHDEKVEIYLGKKAGLFELNMLAIFFMQTKGIDGRDYPLEVMPLESYPGPLRENVCIVVGNATELLEAGIPLAANYDVKEKKFHTAFSAVPVLGDYEEETVLLQLFAGGNKPFSLVIALPPGIPAMRGFRKAINHRELKGTVALVNKEGEVLSYSPDLSEKGLAKAAETRDSLLLGIFVIAVSAVFSWLVYRLLKRRKNSK